MELLKDILKRTLIAQGLDSITPTTSTLKPKRPILAEPERPLGLTMPDEAQCPVCGYWDIFNPEVHKVLAWREWNEGTPSGWWHRQAGCHCAQVKAKKEQATALRRSEANLPRPHDPRTFSTFKDMPGTEEGRSRAEAFAGGLGPRCLLLVGETGCGKSRLLEAIGWYVLDNQGCSVRYETCSSFLDRLRHTFSEERESVTDVMHWYQSRTVLLIDDLGTRAEKDWAIQELTDLVDERIRNGLWLAVATNLVKDEVAEAVGDRLASRLFQANEELHEVSRVTITAGDYRMRT